MGGCFFLGYTGIETIESGQRSLFVESNPSPSESGQRETG